MARGLSFWSSVRILGPTRRIASQDIFSIILLSDLSLKKRLWESCLQAEIVLADVYHGKIGENNAFLGSESCGI